MESFEAVRQQVAAACHRLHAKDLCGSSADSFSMRIAGDAAMALTPAGCRFAEVRAEAVSRVALADEGDAEAADAVQRALHRSIYRLRPDVGAIAHTHQRWASGLRLLDAPMPGIFDEQVRQLGRSLRRLPFSAPALGREAIALLKAHDNAYLFGDGVLVLGVTADRAVFNAELIEKCAKAHLLASATGLRVGTVPLFVREIAHRRMRKDQQRAAAAYARGEVPTGFTAY
jgi:ribulose-5-phosphate 4-epimerase/fuculose-1-phosphate aldolase